MAKKKLAPNAVTPTIIESRIHLIRDARVMLDFELAELYDIPTFALNQAVSRNADRFPSDFAYQLTQEEFANLKSQNATSSSAHGGRRKLPWAFTEHGVAMLSSVLRSPTATQVNIEIIRSFVRLRKLLATPGEILTIVKELAETVALHDGQIKQIAGVLHQMFAPPPQPTHDRKLGFQPPSQLGLGASHDRP